MKYDGDPGISIQESKRYFRLDTLTKIFEDIQSKVKWEGVYLNEHLLLLAIDNYFEDINRLKDYIGSDYADQHKKAAFTIKWINRVRPIQIHQSVTQPTRSQILANALYGYIAGFNHLEGSISSLSTNYMNNFLNMSLVQALSARQLASEMYVVEKTLLGSTP